MSRTHNPRTVEVQRAQHSRAVLKVQLQDLGLVERHDDIRSRHDIERSGWSAAHLLDVVDDSESCRWMFAGTCWDLLEAIWNRRKVGLAAASPTAIQRELGGSSATGLSNDLALTCDHPWSLSRRPRTATQFVRGGAALV